MMLSTISDGADGHGNEDLVAVFRREGVTDIVVIDGATHIAGEHYIEREAGDVVWFVKSFAAALEAVAGEHASQEKCVVLALDQVRHSFRELTRGRTVPAYALPIAAMSWIRITRSRGLPLLELFCLGDCKAFLLSQDGAATDLDPYQNPQEAILQKEIARLAGEGVLDAAARRERLMPMLRARRESQNAAAAPSILCLEPRGPFEARKYRVQPAAGSTLLAMTDGFYRIVDTYGMHTIEALGRRCRDHGLEAALRELRAFETALAEGASTSVKKADDASAAMLVIR